MIEYIPLDELNISSRQRKTFNEGDIITLAEDIEKNDLLHCPVIRAANPPTLVAGGRRVKAMAQLIRQERMFSYGGVYVPYGMIPVLRVSERDELAYRETELSENLARVDLSWQEESSAKAELHRLRLAQTAGEQTLKSTARELLHEGGSITNATTELRMDLALSDNLDDPAIAAAKTKREAKKLLQLKLQKAKHERLSEEFANADHSSPHILLQGDSTVLLQTLPTGAYAVLCTDPPYGVDAHTFGDQTAINHEYDDTEENWKDLMVSLASESFRCCAPEAHAYVFCDIRRFEQLYAIFALAGWGVWTRPLIWSKGNQGTLPRPEHGPRLTYEAILYAIKGDRTINMVRHDVLSYPSAPKPLHAAEKPIPLLCDLLERSVLPGDKILDPFCGSGTIFPAASAVNCIATGVELSTAAHGIATMRLEEEH